MDHLLNKTIKNRVKRQVIPFLGKIEKDSNNIMKNLETKKNINNEKKNQMN